MAKPYSTSHTGFVSSGFTDMRLSGAVKEQLVEMLVAEIDQMVPAMEAATLSATPRQEDFGRHESYLPELQQNT